MTRIFCDKCGDQLGIIDRCHLTHDVFGDNHPEHGAPYRRTLKADLCGWCLGALAEKLLSRLTDAEAETFFAELQTATASDVYAPEKEPAP